MNDKYLHYTLEDYLNDDAFVKDTKGRTNESNLEWEQWIKTNPEQGDLITHAKRIIMGLQFEEDQLIAETSDKMWNNIQESVSTSAKIEPKTIPLKSNTFLWRRISIGIAACIALFVIVNNWNPTSLVEFENTTALVKSIELPDLSIVSLSEGSDLSYHMEDWDNQRRVNLNGEAFFEVKKGKRFSVHTDRSIVQVLGTSFNVYDVDGILNVSCKTGSVSVISIQHKDTIILKPGEGVRMFHNDELRIYHFNIAKLKEHQANILNYESQMLANVFEEIEALYDVKIVYEKDMSNALYTGQLTLGDIQKTMKSICWTMHLKFHIEGKNITITK